MELKDHPLSNIQWLPKEALKANSWNPNYVLAPELKLLKYSLLKQGWIQPVLVNHEPGGGEGQYEIIDGYHRTTLTKSDEEVSALTGGLVPCCVFNIPVPERMMLTIRINRAKGNHQAFKMHDIVTALINDFNVSRETVASGIGADRSEIELLLTDTVFKKLGVEDIPFSRAWEGKDS